jgi:hypothetical protein
MSYGFVTEANPHDHMALFDSLEAALDWLFSAIPCRFGTGSLETPGLETCSDAIDEQVRTMRCGVSLWQSTLVWKSSDLLLRYHHVRRGPVFKVS